MVTSQKALLSLLISVVLFAGFSALAFTGLFNLVETRFYNPAVSKAVSRELNEDTETIEGFLEELQTRFAATLQVEAVRRSFIANLSDEDITERSQIYGALLESVGGLQSVRVIDSVGIRIHYSTWQPDILRQDQTSIAYRNYTDPRNPDYIPYWQIEAPDRGSPRLFLDQSGERIIFSHPVYDSFDVYRGTAAFSLSVRAVIERMVLQGRIKVGEDVSVISEPPGMIIGLPYAGKDILIPLISRIWSENILSLGRLDSALTETNLSLISAKTTQGIFVGCLVNESILSFPLTMRIILLASFFITVYLIIFLLLNIRQDNMTIVQNRLKWLQINLIEEYYEHKGNLDLSHWRKELEQRKEDVFSELKRGLKTKDSPELDVFIDKAWEDLLSVIGGRMDRRAGIDGEKLKSMLNQFLLDVSPTTFPSQPAGDPPEMPIQTPPALPGVEDLEEAEAIDEIEAMEDVQYESASMPELALEELEELPEPEPVEELLPDEGLEPEPVEELLPDEGLEPEAVEEVLPDESLEPEPVEELLPDEGLEPEPVEELLPDEGLEPEPVDEVLPDGPAADPSEVLDFLAETASSAEPETIPEEPQEVEEIEPLEVIPEFQQLDPSEVGGSGEILDEGINSLASKVEFSSIPEEVEKEEGAGTEFIGEDFEIQSPFTTIFSALSEVEFEPEPTENLESLERERIVPDGSLEVEAEQLNTDYVKPLFVRSFSTAINEQIEILETQADEEIGNEGDSEEIPEAEAEILEVSSEDENAIISERDGISYINENILTPDEETVKSLDKNFKKLIDSVLNNT
ncbi:MAG: hypothetical protein LBB98_09370 [Treponema sp.]|nr:hypothetical protein [Treponema sp.]